MLKNPLIACVIVAMLGACDDKVIEQPGACSGGIARIAAVNELAPIIERISNPETRADGCQRLDRLLEDSAAMHHYERDKPSGCDWGYGLRSPYEQATNILKTKQDALAKLCDWARKDAAMEAQRRGEDILGGLPPEDRQALERAYEGR